MSRRLALVPASPARQRELLAQLERDLGDGTGGVLRLERPLTETEVVAFAQDHARAAERHAASLKAKLAELEGRAAPQRSTRADALAEMPETRRLLGLAETPSAVPTPAPTTDALGEQMARLLGRPTDPRDAA
jgi:hypothetical protein